MDDTPRSIPVGAATVTIINAGDLVLTLSETSDVPESEWRAHKADFFDQPLNFPSQSVHISLPGASVVVDPNDYFRAFLDSPYLQPGYQPPPGLVEQLRARSVQPEEVTHVVITHTHFDHYAAVTTQRDGQFVPTFPNARYFVQRADWESPEIQRAVNDPDSGYHQTLAVLHTLGLLELVDGERELLPGLQLIPTPGESPGHQIVKLQSQGQTLYCLGDLYHHPIEVEHPTWMARWDDPVTSLSSRRKLATAALAENALLIAAHIDTIGRLEATQSGVSWKPADLA